MGIKGEENNEINHRQNNFGRLKEKTCVAKIVQTLAVTPMLCVMKYLLL